MTSTDPRYAALALAAQHIEANRLDAARDALSSLVNNQLALDDRQEDLLYFLLAAGLSKRLEGPTYEEINLYLRDYDVPQIRLFNLLAERVPTMALGTWLANKMLVRTLREHARPTLVDFGTGTGRQMVSLLRMLNEDPRSLTALRLVLIEPDPNSLKRAVESASSAARECRFSVEIQAIPKLAEEMDDHDWRSLMPSQGTLVINESFTLHHVSDEIDGGDGRDTVLARIRALEPELFVATEPDVDHDTMRLSDRLAHCHQHFRSMFAQIDRLDIVENDRAAIKVCFFGREMEDILGAPDATRAERHDRAHRWLERMRNAGLKPIDLDELNLPAPEVSGVELFTRDGHLSLGFQGEPLLAVLAASGRGGAADERVAMPGRMSIPAPRARHAAFDAAAHVTVLAAVALADGVIDPREKTVIQRHAALANVDVNEAFEHAKDLQFLTRLQTSERTRRAILRDCIVLAKLSGAYREPERKRIAEIAAALGMPERALAEAEQRAEAVAPPVIANAPTWLEDYWALAQGR
jgi:tellurite resistance protein